MCRSVWSACHAKGGEFPQGRLGPGPGVTALARHGQLVTQERTLASESGRRDLEVGFPAENGPNAAPAPILPTSQAQKYAWSLIDPIAFSL